MIATALGLLSGLRMSIVGLAVVGTLLVLTALAGALAGGMSLVGAVTTTGGLVLFYNVGLAIGLVQRPRAVSVKA